MAIKKEDAEVKRNPAIKNDLDLDLDLKLIKGLKHDAPDALD